MFNRHVTLNMVLPIPVRTKMFKKSKEKVKLSVYQNLSMITTEEQQV